MFPQLKVINKNFDLLGVVDAYTSLQAERRLWEVGSLDLHMGLKDQGADALRIGNIVLIDEHRCWEITGVKKNENKDLSIVASGHELKGFLGQRVVIPGKKQDQFYFGWDRVPDQSAPDASAEFLMKTYVNRHAAAPEDPKRKFPNLTVAASKGRGIKTRWSERFKQLDQTLKDIGEFTGIGYEVYLDFKNKQFVFEIIPEVNQIAGSTEPVIFSVNFENVESMTYDLDTSKDVTIAYAGGSGTDENRLIQSVARTPEDANLSGFSRKEKWLDCGSCQTVDDLDYEAKHQLSKLLADETLSCRSLPNNTFRYLRDWNLGSIVTLMSSTLGVQANKKITGIKEIYERGKVDIEVTFGKRAKNILDEIRKAEVVR